MTTPGPRLAAIDLPEFGEPAVGPQLPAERCGERIEQLRSRMASRGFDRLIS